MKRIFYSLLIAAVILPGATAHLQARDRKPKTSKTVQAAEPVRNVILMIGDGMGLAQVTSYMLRGGAPLSLARAQSIGLQSTFSASSEVTDSAAAATALSTLQAENEKLLDELAQVKRERDAAVEDLSGQCEYCLKRDECVSRKGPHWSCWEWRGPVKED